MKGTWAPTRLGVLIPTQHLHVVELTMSQRTSEITKYLNVIESSFTIQCPGITEAHQEKMVYEVSGFAFLVAFVGWHWISKCGMLEPCLEWSFTVTITWSFTQLQFIGVMLNNSVPGAITFYFCRLE